MATASRAPKAQPTAPAETAEAPAPAPAEILSATVAAVIPMYVGHTGNNKIKLAVDNWELWAPTMAELVGAHADGVVFYCGPQRKRTTKPDEPGVWENVDLRDKLGKTHAEAKAWYAPMDRMLAGVRHTKGAELMGCTFDAPEATFRPRLADLDEIQRAEDPMATLRRLASPSKTSSATSADGLTSEGRRKLDSAVKALLRKLKKNEPWSGTLTDIQTTYTRDQIIASMTRVTAGTDDGPKWVRAIETATKPKAE